MPKSSAPGSCPRTTTMSLRRRSNRTEKVEYQRTAGLGTPTNVIGLPSLPYELLVLIVSFFPTCRIPDETYDLPNNALVPRHKMLLVLTMTCRALRGVCLPFLWERIEARFGMEGVDNVIAPHDAQHWTEKAPRATVLHGERLAREIRRQLQTVTVREPKYATFVKYVAVLLRILSVDQKDMLAPSIWMLKCQSILCYQNCSTVWNFFLGFIRSG